VIIFQCVLEKKVNVHPLAFDEVLFPVYQAYVSFTLLFDSVNLVQLQNSEARVRCWNVTYIYFVDTPHHMIVNVFG
jgi:hypothetical protein